MLPTTCDDCGVCCLNYGSQPSIYLLLETRPEFAEAWRDREDVIRAHSLPAEARLEVLRADSRDKRCCWLTEDMRCKWHEWRPECCRRFEMGCEECLTWRSKFKERTIVVDELLKELDDLNALAQVRNNYSKTLALLRALKAGKVSLEDVRLTADGWQVGAVTSPLPEIAVELTETVA